MIAIFTKFLAPTSFKQARVKAYCKVQRVIDGTVTLNWDHGVSAEENHMRAAKKLAEQCAWSGNWYMGDGGEDYVHVRVPATVDSVFADGATFFVPYDRDAEAKRIEAIMNA